MKVKVCEASGPALDWMVAKCEGHSPVFNMESHGFIWRGWYERTPKPDQRYRRLQAYSTDWALGGPIIEREEICLKRQLPCSIGYNWNAWIWTKQRAKGGSSAGGSGPTPLIAAMRCYVASKLGDEVEGPTGPTGLPS